VSTEEPTSAPAHTDRWGDPISAERQDQLQAILDAWNTPGAKHGDKKGPFDQMGLVGADIYWLAERSGRNQSYGVPDLHLEGADFTAAHLQGANLSQAHLEGASLGAAHLRGADLTAAHLQRARLVSADLVGASLREAHLEGANLCNAQFDKTTSLNDAALDGVALDQITFDGVNLAVIEWSAVKVLGDETRAHAGMDEHGKRKDSATRLKEYKSAVRANRLLAVALRAQGLNEDADRYAYRAQMLQSHVWARQGKWLANLGNNLLYVLAGYGYKPARSLLVYLATVLAFAVAYYTLGHNVTPPLSSLDALVFSITSFHGRGFSPGEAVTLHNPLSVLAAAEAVIGLLIEISFIATFTQRFFGAK
jgi:hypothetical protein